MLRTNRESLSAVNSRTYEWRTSPRLRLVIGTAALGAAAVHLSAALVLGGDIFRNRSVLAPALKAQAEGNSYDALAPHPSPR